MGIEAGEADLRPLPDALGNDAGFVSFPNGRNYMENRDQLLWSPVNPAA